MLAKYLQRYSWSRAALCSGALILTRWAFSVEPQNQQARGAARRVKRQGGQSFKHGDLAGGAVSAQTGSAHFLFEGCVQKTNQPKFRHCPTAPFG